MKEWWNNNLLQLNGRVKPSIVLRSETELLIAQNAHNLIWEKYRAEYDKLDFDNAIQKLNNEIKKLEKADSDTADIVKRRDALREQRSDFAVKPNKEIDQLIKDEIAAYRSEQIGKSGFNIEERFEALEGKLRKIKGIADDAQGIAEEALGLAEEAQAAAEEAQEAAEEAKSTAEEALDAADSEDKDE